MNEHPQIVYIVGVGRSGSTLVDMVLGAHSEIFSLGEIRFFPESLATNARCACRMPVRGCPVWRSVVDQLSNYMGVDLLKKPRSLTLHVSDNSGSTLGRVSSALKVVMAITLGDSVLRMLGMGFASDAKAVDTIFHFFDVVRQVSRCAVLVDSSKNAQRAQLLCLERPNCRYRVIHLVRDGRGYVHSCMKRTFTIEELVTVNGITEVVRRKHPSPQLKTASQAARDWLKVNLVTMLRLRTLPSEYWLRLRYEDFCRDPVGQLECICRFIGVQYEESMLNFRLVVHHNIGGNPTRFRSEGILPLDDTWRTALSYSDLKVFERTAGWLNRYYGYR